MKITLFQGIFTPYNPCFMAYLGDMLFANMGGGGCRACLHKRIIRLQKAAATRQAAHTERCASLRLCQNTRITLDDNNDKRGEPKIPERE